MGNNIDIGHMLGLKGDEVKCPKCNHDDCTWFDDYDIECDSIPKLGVWDCMCYCQNCYHEFSVIIKMSHTVEYKK